MVDLDTVIRMEVLEVHYPIDRAIIITVIIGRIKIVIRVHIRIVMQVRVAGME